MRLVKHLSLAYNISFASFRRTTQRSPSLPTLNTVGAAVPCMLKRTHAREVVRTGREEASHRRWLRSIRCEGVCGELGTLTGFVFQHNEIWVHQYAQGSSLAGRTLDGKMAPDSFFFHVLLAEKWDPTLFFSHLLKPLDSKSAAFWKRREDTAICLSLPR